MPNNLINKINFRINALKRKYLMLILFFSLKRRIFKPVAFIYFRFFSAPRNIESRKNSLRKRYPNANFDNFFKRMDTMHAMRKKYKENTWKKENINGKRLLLFSEHGLGDTIMFLRYFPLLKEKNIDVTFQGQNDLKSLIVYNYPWIKPVKSNVIIYKSEYDYTTNMMLLFYNLNQNFRKIPAKPYLKVPEEKIQYFAQKEEFQTKKLKVVFVTQSNSLYAMNIPKNAPSNLFLNILKNEDIQPYFLKKSVLDKLEVENAIKCDSMIKDFSDTAGILKNVDIVVSIDTGVIHLAGALGIKSYLLLTKDPEWRWFNSSKTTPWYDSVEIIRQKKKNDWTSVVEVLNEKLQKEIDRVKIEREQKITSEL